MTKATRRSPLCCANTSQAARTSPDRAAASTAGSPPTSPAARAPCSIGTISDARIRADSSSRSNLPLTSTIWPFSARWPYCLNASGNTTTSMLPVGIVEHEHAHAVALARLERPQARDDAADRDRPRTPTASVGAVAGRRPVRRAGRPLRTAHRLSIASSSSAALASACRSAVVLAP